MNATYGTAPTLVTSLPNVTHGHCNIDGKHVYHIFLILYIVILLIGIPFNCFSLYVSWQHIREKNEIGVYLFNLALADFCFVILCPIWVDYIQKDRWIHGKGLCDFSVFLMYTNYYSSSTLLCCISLDRYLAVVHPLKYPTLRRVKTAACISLTVWLFTIIFNATTMSRHRHYDDKICFDIYPMFRGQDDVYIVRFFVGFLLPSLVTAFCCWEIHRAVKMNLATEQHEQKRLSMLLAAITFTVWVCFGPIHITMLLRALLETDCSVATWLYTPFKTSLALSALNCLADPLLYCFVTRTGKSKISHVVFSIHKKRKSTGRELTETKILPV